MASNTRFLGTAIFAGCVFIAGSIFGSVFYLTMKMDPLFDVGEEFKQGVTMTAMATATATTTPAAIPKKH
ncbi:hypothetical protein GOP47_0009203 [Adiantum capillus-veneris]|uniref:Uncharacterized protein n=1 Tax=Adiantum capillus-veneris TaxID=13818 RepID=A0A9D4ZIG6_ADICA|nr:hypothetical protein GOP47_0009203 [Adiantum capillus-veneris]